MPVGPFLTNRGHKEVFPPLSSGQIVLRILYKLLENVPYNQAPVTLPGNQTYDKYYAFPPFLLCSLSLTHAA